jgi:hypothetical protein
MFPDWPVSLLAAAALSGIERTKHAADGGFWPKWPKINVFAIFRSFF